MMGKPKQTIVSVTIREVIAPGIAKARIQVSNRPNVFRDQFLTLEQQSLIGHEPSAWFLAEEIGGTWFLGQKLRKPGP